MKKLILTISAALMATAIMAGQNDHARHEHGHGDESKAHAQGLVTIADTTYRVTSHGEITPGTETAIGVKVVQGKAPGELRSWIGTRNSRGSVKALLRADSHGYFHGHLEVPVKLPQGSSIWLDVETMSGRQRGAVSIPEEKHTH